MNYSSFNFCNFKDSALKELMDKTEELFNTDIEYIQYTLKDTSKEEFIVVLYNLVLAIFDIRKKAPYYNMNNLVPWLNGLMKILVDNMSMHIIDKNIVERRLKEYKEDSQKDIKRYFDILTKGDINA